MSAAPPASAGRPHGAVVGQYVTSRGSPLPERRLLRWRSSHGFLATPGRTLGKLRVVTEIIGVPPSPPCSAENKGRPAEALASGIRPRRDAPRDWASVRSTWTWRVT